MTLVLDALNVLEAQPTGEKRLLRIVPNYNVPNVSEKVVRVILSYVGYVSRLVWRKA